MVKESTREVNSPMGNRSSVSQSNSNVVGNVSNVNLEVEPNARRLLQTKDYNDMAMPPLSSPSLELLNREELF